MRFTTTSSILLALSAPVLGHFNLVYPTSRGSNHETQTTAPCGGLNDFSTARTLFNPDGSPVATSSSHSDSGIEIKFCPSSSDCSTNDDFNVTLVPIFFAIGAGNFCLPNVTIPNSVYPSSRSSSLNGTIQVIYSSDDGELYNCADVSISLQGAEASSQCTNSTGISSGPWMGSLGASESESGSATTSGVAAAASSSSAAANSAVVSGSLLGMALVSLGLAAL
ncbi:hypothetical protein POJ06DRAFT_238368 [Lipomyces tetrasporus]|uniref:Copper acquisition factor BIM1-like domain-containing protein n=1 Tax=Lipomyces tetrasporus TaxID=54092 RepID=A0AAD7VT00_9ASCO|nr:uncharacterized protein POJ06DRAFT_238368 [Lipomyces tetrasporus]KAJ8099595.1 hypothetical protein POJ06DRAFT_238368 [Lipomyces tetrasporus]